VRGKRIVRITAAFVSFEALCKGGGTDRQRGVERREGGEDSCWRMILGCETGENCKYEIWSGIEGQTRMR
jgi:hypothetical protein